MMKLRLPEHKVVPRRDNECPFCEAGIPKKSAVPLTDMSTGETLIQTMSIKNA